MKISVHNVDFFGREWMKQTLKEDAEAPGPRNTIKGQTKRKHQITYLAGRLIFQYVLFNWLFMKRLER